MTTKLIHLELSEIFNGFKCKKLTRNVSAGMLISLFHTVESMISEGTIKKEEKNELFLLLLQNLDLLLNLRHGNIFSRFLNTETPITSLVIQNISFADLVIQDIKLSKLIFIDCNFSSAFMSKIKVIRSMFYNCNFDDAILDYGTFNQCEINSCSFRKTSLINTRFNKTKFFVCDIDSAIQHNTIGIRNA